MDVSYLKKALSTAAIGMLFSAGALTVASSPASARVVCNSEGDCWHTDKDYRYGRDTRVEVHPDSWYFHQDWSNQKDRRYRDHHDDRGYYKSGAWVGF
jgi:hypothetical protein